MFHHRVADHQADEVRNRKQFVVKRSAIQNQGVTGPTMKRNKLVHDTAARADEFILCFLAKPGYLHPVNGATRNAEEGISGGNFNGRRGTQAGAYRNLAVDQQVRALKVEAGSLEMHGNSHRIIAPGLRPTYAIAA